MSFFIKLSKISALHYSKFICRSITFLFFAYLYFFVGDFFSFTESEPTAKFIPFIMSAIWLVFAVEMVLRLFPSPYESMGCQKQFKRNYKPTRKNIQNSKTFSENPTSEKKKLKISDKQDAKVTWLISMSYLLLQLIIAILYFSGIIDKGMLFLISLAFSVCDMICILFFCPFQTFFMKNKCCVTCRIYNWDYLMMFIPLILIPSFYTWSLVGIATILVIRWEITYKKHPQWFLASCNSSLHCNACTEKLCSHKKQLQKLLRTTLKGTFKH